METIRKGARSVKDIPKNILEQLNRGEIETANLMEWLAVDQTVLLENILIQFDRLYYLQSVLSALDNLKKQTVTTICETIGTELFWCAIRNNDADFLFWISVHPSDMVRCWSTYSIGKDPSLNIRQMLRHIQPFAADRHFGVREIAWLAVRSGIADNLTESIEILTAWTKHEDETVRRFASEATRPRGVWCEHIKELKQHPELGLGILEALKSDHARYVQDSVGNWLNDASKSRPDFVRELCLDWEKSGTKETTYIIKKAMKTIDKSKLFSSAG